MSTLEYTGWSYGAIPLIWVFMMMIRGGCLTVFNLLFRLLGEREGPCCPARCAVSVCMLGCCALWAAVPAVLCSLDSSVLDVEWVGHAARLRHLCLAVGTPPLLYRLLEDPVLCCAVSRCALPSSAVWAVGIAQRATGTKPPLPHHDS